ncbi:MAG: hypothetical protein K2K45_04485 [Muribaculaceae bacterium]|nr:hypothetical protein [Muribaculaceae bacterium]
MKIAELLIRTVVEIESLAKNLYFSNGGSKPDDKDLYFDTDCMALLVDIWGIDKKVVLVSSPNIFLTEETNLILTPLHKSNKRGSSSADWCKAYQAVKHNRVKELKRGNLNHFLRALAALYILNLYFKDDKVNFITPGKDQFQDFSFGSQIFSVLKPNNISSFSTNGTYPKGADFEKHVYVAIPDNAKYQEVVDLLNEKNNIVQQTLINELQIGISNGEISPDQDSISKFLTERRRSISNDVFRRSASVIGQKTMNMSYTAELNKNQAFFSTPPTK